MASSSDTSGMAKSGMTTVSVSVPTDVLSALETFPGLFIKQHIDPLELVCGCEQSNKYDVHGWRPPTGEKPTVEEIRAGATPEPIMRAVEDKGDMCHRQLCGADRAFSMKVNLVLPGGMSPAPSMLAPLELTRPFKCTCLWADRPVLYVWWGGKVIAEVGSPFKCCKYHFTVGPPTSYAERSEVHPDMVSAPEGEWYSVIKSECDNDICCEGCSPEIKMPILDSSGERVGNISRVWKGCCADAHTKADDFSIAFPDGSLPIQRAAVVGACILVDMYCFEHDNNNNGGGGY